MFISSRGLVIVLLTVAALAGCSDEPPPLNSTEPVYRVGGVEIAIPAPATDMVEGNQFITVLQPTMPADFRIVALHGVQDEFDRAGHGVVDGRLTRYGMIQAVRSIEHLDATPADFDAFVESTRVGLEQFRDNADAALAQSGADIERMKSMGIELASTEITIDGEIFSRPDAVGLGMSMPLILGDLRVRQLCATAMIRTRERIITANLYVEDDGRPETKAWLHDTIEAWAIAIQNENDPD